MNGARRWVIWSCFSNSMISGILVLVITGVLAFVFVDALKRRFPYVDVSLLKWLFFFHVALALAYYVYALFNPSDSIGYFRQVISSYRGETWSDHYGTSTIFITFIAYPFIKYLGFSYEGMMALFAFFGFIGFCYFHVFFKEQIRFRHEVLGYDLTSIILFLPNLHFWSSSLGKGAVIFLGMAVLFFGLSDVKRRWAALIFASILIYHIRPHIMLLILVSSIIGFMFSSRGIATSIRLIVLLGAAIALYYTYKDVFKMVGIDEENFVSQGLDLTHRASELTKATSGVDITNYSLPLQVFTFLFRPLFFDAPGALGLFVSVENLFFLLMTLRLMSWSGVQFLFRANFLVKSAFLSFLFVSIALAQISGNLGLAIRQKSQVMILFLFVILMFLDDKKYRRWLDASKRKQLALPRKPKVASTT